MAKKFKQIMTPQEFTETIKEIANQEYPIYTTDMVERDEEPVMPHIEEELEKIVEKDIKIKNLEDETSLLDAKIQEFKEVRIALSEAAKIIDKLYPDLIKATDQTALEIEYFRDTVKRIADIIEKVTAIKLSTAVDKESLRLLHEHTTITLEREKRQMDEHVEQMKNALKTALDENYRMLKERLSKEEGVYLSRRAAAWLFGLFIVCGLMIGISLAMQLK